MSTKELSRLSAEDMFRLRDPSAREAALGIADQEPQFQSAKHISKILSVVHSGLRIFSPANRWAAREACTILGPRLLLASGGVGLVSHAIKAATHAPSRALPRRRAF